ncbi:MFS transporter [Pseudooceanicola sp. CBS1P-1]|uniref:MFS transporter n=1 Tax=Pseudooceanicola albus TaxID=2692189 RepID=A0A6L7G453_9RHOB|nr:MULTISPECIES: MFS transporter [Pseudooceanicola]MBT9382955.1 MFS transporter [Pseudooceanicola endophyticus]MXN19144.1 MFS transporter [Pseudooceanicola albus]
MSSSGDAAPAGAYAPFRQRAFALLWTATLISNIGTWMNDVGSGWLMTTLDPSPAVVTLVQAATTLPVFCFALLAGALADRLDKRRMLIAINLVLLVVVSTLTLLVWAGRMTPALLIAFTLMIGTGAAFVAPAWQAIVPQLVPRDQLRPAIALNSMGINIARAIGPAIAGVLIAGVGLAAPFALNALSFVAILIALVLWQPPPALPVSGGGSLLQDMATGLRHVRHNRAMRDTALRAAAFFLFASAYWALLPLIARGIEGGGSTLYGALMGVVGAGAVTGALLLPRLQRRASADGTVRLGTLGTGLAPLLVAAFLGGLSWIAVLTSFNVSAQTALPGWVRARGLAVFLMVFFGSMALGSLVWGQVATALSVPGALLLATAGLALGLLVTLRLPLGQAEGADLSPAQAWPMAPEVTDGQARDSSAMVLVEYRIAPPDREAFLALLPPVAHERLRNGATRWHVHECVETPGLWLESFHLPSWAEHLAQHERVSHADLDHHARLRTLHQGTDPPRVRHFIGPKR